MKRDHPDHPLSVLRRITAENVAKGEAIVEVPAHNGLYYGFADKATFDAVQRDKASSPWIQGRV